MNRQNKFLVVLTVAILAITLGGCGASSGSGAAASTPETVSGVSTPSQVSVVSAR